MIGYKLKRQILVLSIIYLVISVICVSCVFSSSVATETDNRSEYTGVGNQIELNIIGSQPRVEIHNVTIVDNVTFRGKPGIAINFDCKAYGFRGSLLYFYAFVLYENDYDFVKKLDGSKTHGFDVTTIMHDAVKFDEGVNLYIPYSDLPERYHGELCIDLVIKDDYDNIIAQKPNNRFFYTTL